MKYLPPFQWDTILLVVCIFVITAVGIAVYWLIYLMGYDDPRFSRVLLTVGLLLVAFMITLATLVIMLISASISFYRKQF
jgi:hypothetical protein